MSNELLPTRRELRASQKAGASKPRRTPRPHLKRAVAQKLFSASALLFAGLLLVGMSVPASAFRSGDVAAQDLAASIAGQSLDVSTEASEAGMSRAEFEVTSYAQALAQKYGRASATFEPTTGSIRWPFPYPTTITDGFGPRVSPCSGCSSQHKGLDFTPGDRAPVYAIADGVVESSMVSNGGFGTSVIINHVIKGKAVQSVYAHFTAGSTPLKAGDKVEVGNFVGLVGSTGATTGPHLHFELHVDGVAVDPFAWLTQNAN